MHKTFYASGFIYHLRSQQILLQQRQTSSSTTFPWLLFENEYSEGELPETVFRNSLSKFLDIVVDTIYPIYSYTHEITKNNYILLYAPVEKLQEFTPRKGYTFRWFSFKEVLKIYAAEQTKHDIIVGQRVIEAAGRKDRGEHTFQ